MSAIGTVQLAFMYIFPVRPGRDVDLRRSTSLTYIPLTWQCMVISFFRRFPEWARMALWAAVAVNCLAMLAASWATKVWQLILLQGVLCGYSGAVLYTPVLLWLNG